MKILLKVWEDYEQIINQDTNEILAEGHSLSAEDVLFALGYRFEIEEVIEMEEYENEEIYS
jgi:hypothetical protein